MQVHEAKLDATKADLIAEGISANSTAFLEETGENKKPVSYTHLEGILRADTCRPAICVTAAAMSTSGNFLLCKASVRVSCSLCSSMKWSVFVDISILYLIPL